MKSKRRLGICLAVGILVLAVSARQRPLAASMGMPGISRR